MSTPLLLENQLCFRIYSLNKAMVKLYAPLLQELNLTYPQYLVMLVLWQQHEAISVNALGERLVLESGTLSPLLKRMEKLSLLTRTRCADDERKVLVELSAHGKNLKQKAKLIPAKMLSKTGLALEQLQNLTVSLDQLLINISAD
jgi:MarR family transcriptional regulator, organic hydroperoxide resistance regulator